MDRIPLASLEGKSLCISDSSLFCILKKQKKKNYGDDSLRGRGIENFIAIPLFYFKGMITQS